MQTTAKFAALVALAVSQITPNGIAEVIASAPDHYTLRHEAIVEVPRSEVWERLIRPETWWASDHSYSGDAQNLSLEPIAGGQWREDWADGSVTHGVVLSVVNERMLRLDAPFGPLQTMGVTVVWTISLSDAPEGGTRIIFDEVANGSKNSALDSLAPAVDRVKQQALDRLSDFSDEE